MSYRQLHSGKIIETVRRLSARVEERFPGAGLGKVCAELRAVAEEAEERCRWLERPRLWLRFAVAFALALLLVSLIGLGVSFPRTPAALDFAQFVQALEAGINDVVLIGVAVFFLVTLENRLKRSRALGALHELRALAHVIDMHQLTKDPERLLDRGVRTASSPTQTLTAFELSRYLDYCSEMLSIVGKISGLYAQHLDDTAVLAAVTEIEGLTSALAAKVWQKISSLQEMDLPRATGAGEPAG